MNFHLEPQMAEPQNTKPRSSLNFLCSVIAYYTASNPWATPDKSSSILYLEALDIQDSYTFPPFYVYSLILLSLQQCKSRATPMKSAHLCWCKRGIRDISEPLFRLWKKKKEKSVMVRYQMSTKHLLQLQILLQVIQILLIIPHFHVCLSYLCNVYFISYPSKEIGKDLFTWMCVPRQIERSDSTKHELIHCLILYLCAI